MRSQQIFHSQHRYSCGAVQLLESIYERRIESSLFIELNKLHLIIFDLKRNSPHSPRPRPHHPIRSKFGIHAKCRRQSRSVAAWQLGIHCKQFICRWSVRYRNRCRLDELFVPINESTFNLLYSLFLFAYVIARAQSCVGFFILLVCAEYSWVWKENIWIMSSQLWNGLSLSLSHPISRSYSNAQIEMNILIKCCLFAVAVLRLCRTPFVRQQFNNNTVHTETIKIKTNGMNKTDGAGPKSDWPVCHMRTFVLRRIVV